MNFIPNSMENWKVELAAGEQTIAELKIQRGSSNETHSYHYSLL